MPNTSAVNNNVTPSRLEELRRETSAISAKRNQLIKYELNNFPCVRTRKSGIVGPEPDYSIRFARIWHSESGTTGPGPYQKGRFPSRYILDHMVKCIDRRTCSSAKDHEVQDDRNDGWRTRSWRYFKERPSGASGLHHHLQGLITMCDGAVRAWTKVAHKLGVRFHGDYGYDFSQVDKRRLYWVSKWYHSSARKGRTSAAKERRKQRRKSAQKDRIERLSRRGVSPVSVREPLVARASMSCASMRRRWRLQFPNCTWTEYKLGCRLSPILILAFRPDIRVHVPPIVQEAVLKIYKNVEIVPKKSVPMRPLPQTYTEPYTARYNLFVASHLDRSRYAAEYEEILHTRIRPIEESAFPEGSRVSWFYWNRRLEELRAKMELRPSVF